MSDQNFLIYQDDNHSVRVEARLEDENVWLTQRQIVDFFQTAKSTISEHIKNIYAEAELLPKATVRKIRTVQHDVERPTVNLTEFSSIKNGSGRNGAY